MDRFYVLLYYRTLAEMLHEITDKFPKADPVPALVCASKQFFPHLIIMTCTLTLL